MKHILIPTDFSTASLAPIQSALNHHRDIPLRVTLLHLVEPADDIIGGLRMAYASSDLLVVPEAFSRAVLSLEAVHAPWLHSVKAGSWYGSTTLFLRSLLDSLAVDAVVLDSRLSYTPPSKRSVDATPMLRKAAKDVLDVASLETHRRPLPQPARHLVPARA